MYYVILNKFIAMSLYCLHVTTTLLHFCYNDFITDHYWLSIHVTQIIHI